jgi:predicted Zn-dependent peptidase
LGYLKGEALMHFKKLIFFAMLSISIILKSGYCLTSIDTFEAVKSQVKEHTLTNGMKFIVLERHNAPVVSFQICADVGSVREVDGIRGISHLLEHMMFHGTKVVGTKDYSAEAKLLEQLDQINDQLVKEHDKAHPNNDKIKELQTEFDKISKAANELIIPDEYRDMMHKQGAIRHGASTDYDVTRYGVSMPSNKLEFWMAMESDRFMNPVFRGFSEEVNIDIEESYLSRVEDKMNQDFIAIAFKTHPYRYGMGGYDDLPQITRKDIQDYYHIYYVPSNMVVGIVGDVRVDEVFKMADLYFSRLPNCPKPDPLRTIEPEQWGERCVSISGQTQPMIYIGYHQPDWHISESLPLQALGDILGSGNTSRLYESLVKEKKIASSVLAKSISDSKYPYLFLIVITPAKDHTNTECLEAVEAEIQKLKTELVTDEELVKFKRKTMKSMIDRMKNNNDMADILSSFDVKYGDWGLYFDRIIGTDTVASADIQAVAQKYLIKKNRTIGEVVLEK